MVQMYLSLMEDVFVREEVLSLKAQLMSAASVVITSHRSPDGDAVGSSLALQHLLRAMGVEASVVMPDAYAKFLHWMPGQEAVRFHDAEPDAVAALVAKADVLFCLDYNAPSRAGGLADAVKEACTNANSTVVMIDHHQEPEPFADAMSWLEGCTDEKRKLPVSVMRPQYRQAAKSSSNASTRPHACSRR